MSLRNNRNGIRTLRAALESLDVNKHDDVNDDTPREFDPNVNDKPKDAETPTKEGEIQTPKEPAAKDVISRENVEEVETVAEVPITEDETVVETSTADNVTSTGVDAVAEEGTLADGISAAGEGAIVEESQYVENAGEHSAPEIIDVEEEILDDLSETVIRNEESLESLSRQIKLYKKVKTTASSMEDLSLLAIGDDIKQNFNKVKEAVINAFIKLRDWWVKHWDKLSAVWNETVIKQNSQQIAALTDSIDTVLTNLASADILAQTPMMRKIKNLPHFAQAIFVGGEAKARELLKTLSYVSREIRNNPNLADGGYEKLGAMVAKLNEEELTNVDTDSNVRKFVRSYPRYRPGLEAEILTLQKNANEVARGLTKRIDELKRESRSVESGSEDAKLKNELVSIDQKIQSNLLKLISGIRELDNLILNIFKKYGTAAKPESTEGLDELSTEGFWGGFAGAFQAGNIGSRYTNKKRYEIERLKEKIAVTTDALQKLAAGASKDEAQKGLENSKAIDIANAPKETFREFITNKENWIPFMAALRGMKLGSEAQDLEKKLKDQVKQLEAISREGSTEGLDEGEVTVSEAITNDEITVDAEEAAETGEIVVTPDPADPVEADDNEGISILVEEEPVVEADGVTDVVEASAEGDLEAKIRELRSKADEAEALLIQARSLINGSATEPEPVATEPEAAVIQTDVVEDASVDLGEDTAVTEVEEVEGSEGEAEVAEGEEVEVEEIDEASQESQTAVGVAGVTETGETGGDPSEPETDQPASGGDPAGEAEEKEADVGGNAEIVSDPTLDIEEAVEEVEVVMETIEQATKDLGFIEREIGRIEDSNEVGGIDSRYAESLSDSMESIVERNRLSFKVSMPSLESFDSGVSTRLRNTDMTLESFKEFAGKLREKILTAFNYVANLISKVYTMTAGKAKELMTNLEQLKKELNDVKPNSNAPKTIKSIDLAKGLSIDGTVPQDISAALGQLRSVTDELIDDIFVVAAFKAEFAKAFSDKDISIDTIVEKAIGLNKLKYFKATDKEDVTDYETATLLGDRTLFYTIPKGSVETSKVDLLNAGIRHHESETVSDEVTLPTVQNAKVILDKASGLAARVQKLKDLSGQVKAMGADVAKTVEGVVGEEEEVARHQSSVISLLQRTVTVSAKPGIEAARLIISVNYDVARLIKAVIKAHQGEVVVEGTSNTPLLAE
ncbi:MAG: hypothetical protein M0R77_01115 [Gammaproteobacteria bacterium]|nr:hypothetical protein [Acholeplasmataceae bacterium]MCK9529156.1 hypothetical protein [Gammaproteobacteria bacterium]